MHSLLGTERVKALLPYFLAAEDKPELVLGTLLVSPKGSLRTTRLLDSAVESSAERGGLVMQSQCDLYIHAPNFGRLLKTRKPFLAS